MTASGQFRLCSTCKTPIPYGARYYKCSVSTCNKRATALYFCSVPCWDAHVPDARHRDAWAEEETAPSGPSTQKDDPAVRRRVIAPGVGTAASSRPIETTPRSDTPEGLPVDVLVVMSKVKGYIKAHSDLRTSDGVSDPLSDHIRSVCVAAIRSAKANERGTVLARDIEAALRGDTADE